MKPNPIVWFEIYVKDMTRAKRFYESVFQTKLTKLESPIGGLEMWQFPSSQQSSSGQADVGSPGALVRMEGAPVGGGGTIVYFRCADCASEEKRVKDFGGKVERPKTSIGQYGSISLVYDTEGNLIGLHSNVAQ